MLAGAALERDDTLLDVGFGDRLIRFGALQVHLAPTALALRLPVGGPVGGSTAIVERCDEFLRAPSFRSLPRGRPFLSALRADEPSGLACCLEYFQAVCEAFAISDRCPLSLGDQPEYKTGYEQIKAKLRAVENLHSLDDAFVSPLNFPM